MNETTSQLGEIKMSNEISRGLVDPTTIDGMNINEECRDYIGEHGEIVGEVVVFVAYVNGQEIGVFDSEDGAAEALALHV